MGELVECQGRESKMIPITVIRASLSVMAVALFITIGGLEAGDDERLTPRSIPKLSGTEVAGRVEHLMSGINWHGNFDDAMARAAEEGKPLFWLQMVGNLGGGL